MASTWLIWDKNSFPNPYPYDAPFTNPAISIIFNWGGTLLLGLYFLTNDTNLGSGTFTIAVLG